MIDPRICLKELRRYLDGRASGRRANRNIGPVMAPSSERSADLTGKSARKIGNKFDQNAAGEPLRQIASHLLAGIARLTDLRAAGAAYESRCNPAPCIAI
jgi:hypothetical protein